LTQPSENIAELVENKTAVQIPWYVVLFNDEIHSFEDVIIQLIKATGCAQSHAESMTWTVHSEGRARVFDGPFEECFKVLGVLKEIALVSEIQG